MHLNLFLLLRGCILSFFVSFPLMAAPGQYYRTLRSGLWNDVTVWECSLDEAFSGSVQPATDIPNYNCETIRISTGDTLIISTSVLLDQIIVEQNALLIYGNYSGALITVSDGPGIDLMIEGVFEDSSPSNLVWQTNQSSWALGQQATIIRTRSTSATLWKDHYNNGMSTIPATSNWVLRKQFVDPPSISGVDTWYGNLKIENFTPSFWNANLVGSKITGSNSAPVVKGNMEIGTTGISGVKFYSQNSAVNRLKILGDLTIGAGSEFHLEDATPTSGSSGIELWGDLSIHGNLSYDPNDVSDQNRMILFAGQTDQSIIGSGNIACYNFSNAKSSGDLILLRDLEINNRLILEEGKLDLNGNTLTILNSASTAVERVDGWIKSEKSDFSSRLRWNIGTASGVHEFPFGKDNDYIPVLISATSGNIGTVSIATYSTTSNNLPLPLSPSITNLLFRGVESSASMIDRFWYVHKTETSGIGQCSFTYASDEQQGSEKELAAIEYDELSDQWIDPLCCQTQSFVQRRVSFSGVSGNSVWTLINPDEALYFDEPEFSEGDIVVDHTIKIFPVPCEEELYLDYGMSLETPAFFEIFNSTGEIISKGHPTGEGYNTYKIDLSGINRKGIYYLQVMDSFSMKTYKLILK